MSTLDAAIRAKLDETRAYMDGYYDLPNAEEMLAVIDAVLGLHPTIEDGVNPPHCAHCGVREIEPCPTKRAIAEKLGVEVER